ncbi:hypothetical protein BBP00_00000893 [Phytophthora kernoviae]|uniref:Catalase n=1 Tax=Phytophthora kernoviae TaxID=325452 RepID=A0A3F2S1Q4_9STRA|nr:hypothetical protein BBP00_00000893 [Phytophthora kernoviae]
MANRLLLYSQKRVLEADIVALEAVVKKMSMERRSTQQNCNSDHKNCGNRRGSWSAQATEHETAGSSGMAMKGPPANLDGLKGQDEWVLLNALALVEFESDQEKEKAKMVEKKRMQRAWLDAQKQERAKSKNSERRMNDETFQHQLQDLSNWRDQESVKQQQQHEQVMKVRRERDEQLRQQKQTLEQREVQRRKDEAAEVERVKNDLKRIEMDARLRRETEHERIKKLQAENVLVEHQKSRAKLQEHLEDVELMEAYARRLAKEEEERMRRLQSTLQRRDHQIDIAENMQAQIRQKALADERRAEEYQRKKDAVEQLKQQQKLEAQKREAYERQQYLLEQRNQKKQRERQELEDDLTFARQYHSEARAAIEAQQRQVQSVRQRNKSFQEKLVVQMDEQRHGQPLSPLHRPRELNMNSHEKDLNAKLLQKLEDGDMGQKHHNQYSEQLQLEAMAPAVPPVATTSNGAPLPPTGLTASATVGPRGPIVLQDFALLDHLAHFDRERIPERVVHAKGAGAFGYFEVTHESVTKYTSAKLFSSVGKRTPVAVRFSTVGGEQGSADTVRDPRGFAIKFYTEEGNWDLVGNNTPIFFIRDPILFPSFIHTQKRLPSTHLKDDNMMWDFFSLRPETLHQQTFLFSDRGIPDGFRHMNGYGSHTFINLNTQGETTYVKYHFKTDQGIRNLPVDEAAVLASSDPDYSIRDLYDAIQREDFPTWTLYIQTMTPEQAANESVNPFDVTKVWPHSAYPLQEVGRLVLNRNPKNYFAEVEQLAFSPSHMVPGIEPSPDKMLQGRLFSYPDTHRHRLGPNYQQIPVNKPVNKPQTYQRDGLMAVTGNMEDMPNYFPNSMGGPLEAAALRYHASQGDHVVVDKFSTVDEDNFSQAGDFYRKTLDAAARDRLADNIAGSLVNASKPVQIRAIGNFTKADTNYGERVQEKLETLKEKKAASQKFKERATESLNPPRRAFKGVAA